MKVLAIDSGTKRIGLAISDQLEITIRPLATLEARGTDSDVRAICDLSDKLGVEEFVVGLPINMDGTAGHAAIRALRLATEIEKRTGRTVFSWDERLTSVEAKELLRAQGERPTKDRINQVAACLILRDFLARRSENVEAGLAGPGAPGPEKEDVLKR